MRFSFSKNKYFYTFLSILALVAYSFLVFAAPPSSDYNPGEILNPTCGPTDPHCKVAVPWLTDTVSGYAYNTTDNVGIGTATPTSLLSVGATSGFQVDTNGNVLSINGVAYSFPGSQAGASGDVLTNDGSGNLSWAPAGGSSPIVIENTTSLFSNGLDPILSDATNSVFLGLDAGDFATGGGLNGSVFIGGSAGLSASSASQSNFIGSNAGLSASSASQSNFIGGQAGSGAALANNSIFIGNNSGLNDIVDNSSSGTSILIGDNTGTGGNSNSIAIGASAVNTMPNQFLIASAYNNIDIAGVNYVFPNSQAGSSGDVLTNDGSGGLSWAPAGGGPITVENTGSLFSTGLSSISSNADYSILLGWHAGDGASGGILASNFIGNGAGGAAVGSNYSNFIGNGAGYGAVGAVESNFIGDGTGESVTGVTYSNFFGFNAGAGATNAAHSIFIGNNSGLNDIVDNSSSGTSILIGDNTGTGGNSNSIAIGASAVNTMPNQFLIASAYNNIDIAGVNYVFPNSQAGSSGDVLTNDGSGGLSWVPGAATSELIGETNGIINAPAGPGPGTETWFGAGAGALSASVTHTVFVGDNAGYGATGADSSVFVGGNAGLGAVNAGLSNFIGEDAGNGATGASQSNFIGLNAGYGAINAGLSNFIGISAGTLATDAGGSNFFGDRAGTNAANAAGSNFFGQLAGYNATNSARSIFIGQYAGAVDLINSLGSINAPNSIFIGNNAGAHAGDFNLDNTGGKWSIAIGNDSSTGGYSDSIALGTSATNTAVNQFIIGSLSGPIDDIEVVQSGGQECIINDSGLGCTSDERLKTNIADLPTDTLADLLKVRTVNFNWNTNPATNPQIGFLAQDVEQYFPDLVYTNPTTGYMGVYYEKMTPYLVEGVRELDLKLVDIQNFATQTDDTTFLHSLISWLGSATNGIGNLVAKTFVGNEVDVNNLCVTDSSGAKTCITKAQLDQIIAGQNNQQTINTNTSGTSGGSAGTSNTVSDPTTATSSSGSGPDINPISSDTPNTATPESPVPQVSPDTSSDDTINSTPASSPSSPVTDSPSVPTTPDPAPSSTDTSS